MVCFFGRLCGWCVLRFAVGVWFVPVLVAISLLDAWIAIVSVFLIIVVFFRAFFGCVDWVGSECFSLMLMDSLVCLRFLAVVFLGPGVLVVVGLWFWVVCILGAVI